MERFAIKINRIQKHEDDGKFYIVFDVYTNNVKVGEAESEYSIIQGILVSKFQEAVTEAQTVNLRKILQEQLSGTA